MKKVLFITGCIVLTVAVISCDGPRRKTGRAYMPDMTYSRAYETYAPAQERLDSAKTGAHYSGLPVEGTIARGDMMPYMIKNDSAGYVQSASVKNPLDAASIDMTEASRLYLVNCGICHGAKLDGNGPLYKNGNGPFTAAPAKLVGDPAIAAKAEGTMFHVATYGKGQMGSYASQLTTRQRWMVVAYVKSKQMGGATKDSVSASSVAKPDSAGMKKNLPTP
jgi:mono/diheme cytochrome c family protein